MATATPVGRRRRRAQATLRRRAIETPAQCVPRLRGVHAAVHRRFQNSREEEREAPRTVGYARGSA